MEQFRKFLRLVSLCFAAGCFGAAVAYLVLWIFGVKGVNEYFHVHFRPALTASWFYPKIFLGGVWGCLFALPFLKKPIFIKGLIYAIGPAIVELFVILPMTTIGGVQGGVLGLGFGAFMPLIIIFISILWGFMTSVWLLLVGIGK